MTAFDQAWALVKTMGININDHDAPYTDMILSGKKTIETRRKHSLDPYIGRKVGLIRTGKGPAKVVGYATVGKPKEYHGAKSFNRDRGKHRVPKGSKEDKKGESVGYPLKGVKRTKPKSVKSRGIIARDIE